jgi:protease I
MAKVLILTGDAAESLDVMYPYQRLQEEGYEVSIAAPSKKKLHFVVHDFEGRVTTIIPRSRDTAGMLIWRLPTSTLPNTLHCIPGGRALESIRNDSDSLLATS